MTIIHYQQASFLISVAKLHQLPKDEGIEVAFAGRSNAGKSSALNVLTHNKNLARTSKTPGRTQLINLFSLNDHCRLVDLPGYGYAKVAKEMKERWQRVLAQYLETRQCLRGLVLLMDIRHPLKEDDLVLLEFANYNNLAIHILLTKADKLSRGAALGILKQVKKEIAHYHNDISIQLFSALAHTGLSELKATLNEWFLEHRDAL